MKISKKWLLTGLSALFALGLATGCSDDKKPPELVIKDAYANIWANSYNYEGYADFNIQFDESALIGTKGGLSEKEAAKELEAAEQLKSLQSQQMLTMLQNAKLTFHGAFDGNNMKFDMLIGIDFNANGVRMAFEIPMLFEFKEQIAFYIDPKAAKAFGMPPSAIDGKIIKMSLDDIPELTNEQKEKLKPGSEFYKKIKQITDEYMNALDPTLFKDIAVSDELKKDGVVRAIQLAFTPEESFKLSELMIDKFLNAFASDLKLTPEKIVEIKAQYQLSNKKTQVFMGDSIYIYGLNSKDQIVYVSSTQSIKGAKHIANIKMVMTMKDFGKPAFTVDPSKQPVITLTEVRAIDFSKMP